MKPTEERVRSGNRCAVSGCKNRATKICWAAYDAGLIKGDPYVCPIHLHSLLGECQKLGVENKRYLEQAKRTLR